MAEGMGAPNSSPGWMVWAPTSMGRAGGGSAICTAAARRLRTKSPPNSPVLVEGMSFITSANHSAMGGPGLRVRATEARSSATSRAVW